MVLANIRGLPLSGMANLREGLYAHESVPKELSVRLFLIAAPHVFGVLKDEADIPQCLRRVLQSNK